MFIYALPWILTLVKIFHIIGLEKVGGILWKA